MPIGYLLSEYPAVHHTFLQREIDAIGKTGVRVIIVSIRRPKELLANSENNLAPDVHYLLGGNNLRLMTAIVQAVVLSPLAFLRAAAIVFAFAGWDVQRLGFGLAYLVEASAAADIFRTFGVQHVHSHFTSNVAWIMSGLRQGSWSMTIHGPDEFNELDGFRLSEKVAAASHTVAISCFAKSQIMRVAPVSSWERISVIPLGVDVDFFRASKELSPGPRLRLLSVGRLARVKGHLVLLEALQDLMARGIGDFSLEIIGDGPERGSLEAFIRQHDLASRVHLAGWQPTTRIRAALERTDVFVLPSFAEGIPVVLMEAMASGVPCVASGVNGIPELIDHLESGLLVPPADPARLADGIQLLANSPDLRRTLQRNGRLKVERSFCLTTNARHLASVLTRLDAGAVAHV